MAFLNINKAATSKNSLTYAKKSDGIKGFFCALIMLSSTFSLILILPVSQLLHLICMIVIPWIIAFLFLKNVMNALVLVWLNDAFFGVGGMWLNIGPLPGRYLLLLSILFLFLISKPSTILNIKKLNRDSWVVFYGSIFPLTLFLYSFIIRGNSFSNIISDVMRFVNILIFFPLRELMQKKKHFLFGWLVFATAFLSILFISLSIAPDNIRLILIEKWIFGFSTGEDTGMTLGILSSGRAFLTPLILCVIGIFIGIIYVTDLNIKASLRLASLLLLVITSAALVVNFARGPIIAVLIASILLVLLVFDYKWIGIKRLINFMILIMLFLYMGYFFTTQYLPVALTKWDVSELALEEAVSSVRIEQTEKMLSAWLEEPLLGQGVGSPISGYSRDESGLAFEVQYPMILYRTGLIGFVFIIGPLFWIMFRTAKKIKICPTILNSHEGKFLLVMWCSILTLLISSWVNPYLASSMTFVFIVLFLTIDSTLAESKRNSYG